MLQNIRDNVQGVFAKIIMAIIIIPFALFGIDSLLSGGGVVNVAEVNGEELSEFDLQRKMVIQKRNMLSRMGEDIDPALLDDTLIREQVLERLIQEKVLLQRAEDNSLGLSGRTGRPDYYWHVPVSAKWSIFSRGVSVCTDE